MEKKRGWAWLLLSAMILLPPALYVGAYYANATTSGAMWFADAGRMVCPDPRYRVCESVSNSVFAPLHAIDRRLRPDVWSRPVDPWTPLPVHNPHAHSEFLLMLETDPLP